MTRQHEHPDGSWQRVHPLTPFVRSWLIVVAIVWGLLSSQLDDIVDVLVHGKPLDLNLGGTVQVIGAGLMIALLCGILGVIIGLGLLSWWFTRYQVTDEHVRFRSGWLFRTQRQARLDKVQGIDVERRFLPRVLGLASLKFDVADGGSSVMELSFLGREHAQRLRSQLLAAARGAGGSPRAGGADAASIGSGAATDVMAPGHHAGEEVTVGGSQQPGEAETSREVRAAQRLGLLKDQEELRRVFTVPTSRVVLSMVCSVSAIFLVLSLLGAVVLLVVAPDALVLLLPGNVPVLLMALSGLYQHLEKGWGFTLSEVPSGVRVRHGLFNERSSTIPTGRVQAMQVTRPWLWRPFRGHRIRVTTAGKGGLDTEGLQSTVLPVGTWENVRDVLDLVLPVDGAPTDLVSRGLEGSGPDTDYTTSPRSARIFDPFTWRRTGFALTGALLALRWGRLTRQVTLVPHHKTQSVSLLQGPLERRRGLTDITVDLVAGPVTSTVHHLDVHDALDLVRRHAHLSHRARETVRTGGSGPLVHGAGDTARGDEPGAGRPRTGSPRWTRPPWEQSPAPASAHRGTTSRPRTERNSSE